MDPHAGLYHTGVGRLLGSRLEGVFRRDESKKVAMESRPIAVTAPMPRHRPLASCEFFLKVLFERNS